MWQSESLLRSFICIESWCCMSRTITYDSQGNDITCMKEFDALKYPCKECDRTDCEEREDYEKAKSRE